MLNGLAFNIRVPIFLLPVSHLTSKFPPFGLESACIPLKE